MTLIHPVIMSGGSGTRLWPLSRENFPKQFLTLGGDLTMLQQTAGRVSGALFAPPIVVANAEHRFLVAEQLRAINVTPQALVLEKKGRNTAPAAAVGAILALRRDPDAMILVLPSDHMLADIAAFRAAVEDALPAAEAGALVTFAIQPTRPETGYGYIRLGAPVKLGKGLVKVEGFVEKPAREQAEQMLQKGGVAWNSGIFLFRADAWIAELRRFEPEAVTAAEAAVAGASADLDFLRLDPQAFETAPSVSIDVAVMERTDKALARPLDAGWDDLGSWSQIWQVAAKDAEGNALTGDALAMHSKNCLAHSEDGLVALVGVEDLIVVTTGDVVLVAHRDHVQDVRELVEKLRAAGRDEVDTHRRVYRPWGWFQILHAGERFQVKCLSVKPGAKLSLQKHYHRAEHWVVVNGTALITRGDQTQILRENESVFIPLGETHCLENPGRIPLNLIEVQSGAYLGEDDIVRLADTFGRA